MKACFPPATPSKIGALIVRVLGLATSAIAIFANLAVASLPDQILEKHAYQNDAGEKIPYRLALPETQASKSSLPTTRFPLVVILHGAGERGDDNEKQIRSIVPVFVSPENRARYPAFVVAPQCPLDVKWTAINWQQIPHAPQTKEPTYAARLVLELITHLCSRYPVDPSRVYLVGVSMGGSGAWDLLTRAPDQFAGALVLCGGADEAQGHRLAKLPLWCFQGAEDDVVVPSLSRNMIAEIRKAGGTPRYTEFPRAGHSIVDLVFSDPSVVDWLFSQRRSAPR